MNSSKNNKRGGYYWNQPAPCTEEKVAELMLENIKLLLQKKESDIEPKNNNELDSFEQQQQQQRPSAPQLLAPQQQLQQRQQQQQQRPPSSRQQLDEKLKNSGWEIDYEPEPITYSHFVYPLRDESIYPSTVEIGNAEKLYNTYKSTNANIERLRLRADIQRRDNLYGSNLPLSRFAKERLEKEQLALQQASSRASAPPESLRQPQPAPLQQQQSSQASAPPAPPSQQDIDTNTALINSALEQIQRLNLQLLRPSIENVSTALAALTDKSSEQYNRVIQGIKEIRQDSE